MTEWCQEKDVQLDVLGFIRPSLSDVERRNKFKEIKDGHPKRTRCVVCKKRFMSFIRECHDAGCYHVYLPKHKKPVKKRK